MKEKKEEYLKELEVRKSERLNELEQRELKLKESNMLKQKAMQEER